MFHIKLAVNFCVGISDQGGDFVTYEKPEVITYGKDQDREFDPGSISFGCPNGFYCSISPACQPTVTVTQPAC